MKSLPDLNIRNLPLWVQECCLVLVLTLASLVLRQAVYVIFYSDSISYLSFAKNILTGIHHGSGLTIARYRYPPLYPHLIALFSFGGPDPFLLVETGRRVSVAAGSLTVIPLYILARQMFSLRAAVFAAVMLTLTPEFLYYSGSVLTESLSVLIITACLALLWTVTSRKVPLLAHAFLGVMLGLAFLSRHAAIGFLVLALVWVVVSRLLFNGSRRAADLFSGALIPAAVILTGFVAVNLPQMTYIHSETGRWSLTGNFLTDPSKSWDHAGRDLRFTRESESGSSLTPDGTRYIFEESPATGLSSTATAVLKKPVPFIKAYFKTLAGGYLHDTRTIPYPWIILGLGLAGALLLMRERRIKELVFLLWIFGGYYLFLALFHNIRDRYMFPVYPVLLVLAGAGAAAIAGLAADAARKKNIPALKQIVVDSLMVVLVFAFLFPAASGLVKEVNSAYNLTYYRAMNKELTRLIQTGSYVFDRLPHRAYFGEGRFAGAPYDSIERIIDFGRKRGVRYWIVSTDYVPKLRPQYLPLLTRWSDYTKDLVPLGIYEDGAGRTILFEILPPSR